MTDVATIDVDWGLRDSLCKSLIPKKKDRDIFKAYLSMRSERGTTEAFLRQHQITWPDVNGIMHKDKTGQLHALYRFAEGLGDKYRQRLREDEADRRAIEGVEKPIVYKGRKTGETVTEFSDQMLALQLKAGDPEKYSDRKEVKHTGMILNLQVKGVERDLREDDHVPDISIESEPVD
jgi:hypothetical protein